MKVIFATLALFLLAFAGLAAGLLLKRKGLRGGCGSGTDTSRDCRCQSDPAGKPEPGATCHAGQEDNPQPPKVS